MLVALFLFPLLAFAARLIQPPPFDYFISGYIQYCATLFSDEDSWSTLNLDHHRNDSNGAWDSTVTQRRYICDELVPALQKYRHKDPANIDILILLAKTTFSEKAEAKYRSEKNEFRMVRRPSKELLDSLPAMFDHFETVFPGKYNILRRDLYFTILNNGKMFDSNSDLFLADFTKHCIKDSGQLFDATSTMSAIAQGIKVNSKNAIQLWGVLHDHIVVTLGMGKEGFYETFKTFREGHESGFCDILKMRKKVDFDIPPYTNVPSFVSACKIKVNAGKMDFTPYAFYYQQHFNAYLQSLHSQGKLLPHPITGKVLFSKTCTLDEITALIDLFKVMVCLNMNIPRLALTRKEYATANQIEDRFKYDSRLMEQLSSVTKDVKVHFFKHKLHFNCGALSSLLAKNADLCHQVVFLYTSIFLVSIGVSITPKLNRNNKELVICQRDGIFLDPSLTEAECEHLLANLKKEQIPGDKRYTFKASLNPTIASVDEPVVPTEAAVPVAADTNSSAEINEPKESINQTIPDTVVNEPVLAEESNNETIDHTDGMVTSENDKNKSESAVDTFPKTEFCSSWSEYSQNLAFLLSQPLSDGDHVELADKVADLQHSIKKAPTLDAFWDIMKSLTRESTMEYDHYEEAMQFEVPFSMKNGKRYSLPLRVQLPRLDL